MLPKPCPLNTKKIVITGGPGTGKSSLINELMARGQTCFEEISRQVTLEARKMGVEQLFLTEPLLFSELLLKGRLKQFHEAEQSHERNLFLDRGLPDVLAYMDYFDTAYPEEFVALCQNNRYDKVFVLAPWKEIFVGDMVRYENFEQSEIIHEHLLNSYRNFDYDLINVPFDTIEKRTDFILEVLNL